VRAHSRARSMSSSFGLKFRCRETGCHGGGVVVAGTGADAFQGAIGGRSSGGAGGSLAEAFSPGAGLPRLKTGGPLSSGSARRASSPRYSPRAGARRNRSLRFRLTRLSVLRLSVLKDRIRREIGLAILSSPVCATGRRVVWSRVSGRRYTSWRQAS